MIILFLIWFHFFWGGRGGRRAYWAIFSLILLRGIRPRHQRQAISWKCASASAIKPCVLTTASSGSCAFAGQLQKQWSGVSNSLLLHLLHIGLTYNMARFGALESSSSRHRTLSSQAHFSERIQCYLIYAMQDCSPSQFHQPYPAHKSGAGRGQRQSHSHDLKNG